MKKILFYLSLHNLRDTRVHRIVKYEKRVTITGVQRFDETVVEVERRRISDVQNMMTQSLEV